MPRIVAASSTMEVRQARPRFSEGFGFSITFSFPSSSLCGHRQFQFEGSDHDLNLDVSPGRGVDDRADHRGEELVDRAAIDPADVDCEGGGGNGPAYVRGPVTVIGSDIYGLDRDNDGIGCEVD